VSRAAASALVYLALVAAFVYGIENNGPVAGALGWGGVALLALVHLGTGLVGRSFRLALMPLAAIVVAVPAGLPDDVGGEPFPIWFGLVLFAPFGGLLIALGVVLAGRRSL
jgi:hypothetical protein